MPDPLIDRTDLRICDTLQRYGRLPNHKLAEPVSFSAAPWRRRVRRLEYIEEIRETTGLL